MTERLNVLIYNPGRTRAYVELLKAKASQQLKLLFCETEADVLESIGTADVLFVSTRFPTQYLQQAKNVRWVQVMGAGVEKFAKEAHLKNDTILTRVNRGFGEKISEYVLAYMLAYSQRMLAVLANQHQKLWQPMDCSWLYGERLGVAGVGAIGGAIAAKARSFDMQVVGFDLFCSEHPLVEEMYGSHQLIEFASKPKFVSVSMPLTQQSEGLFDMAVFEAMRPDSVFINTSRGGLVNEEDLVAALRQGLIAGAILDVFAEEPLPAASPLWDMPNVIVTPHHSGPSVPEEIVEFFLENLNAWLEGAPLQGVVDKERQF